MVITDEHKKILPWLSAEYCYNYWDLAKKVELPFKRVRELMLELKIAGYVKLDQIWSDDDGLFHGSGHFLTYAGVRLLEDLKIESKIGIEPEYY